ncbi:hypothetical protein SJ05684_c24050 [Sinorhizobium sojae CCBAU 05684]|uniref:Uncharacterized protein n=1 Tax=Sinorhizobium sojae CCBAU 05684 TaxID=716928 RepID=A0A249PDK8_9HYPH|nr:hypothetical protein SJ05684_c24050 [Sinorhizobium sojae CCBAU 05684]
MHAEVSLTAPRVLSDAQMSLWYFELLHAFTQNWVQADMQEA